MAQVVLHIHALDLGGAERVALQWAIWLRDQGHQVFLLVGHQPRHSFFAVPPGITLCFRPKLWGATPGGSAAWLRRWMQDHRPDLAIGITSRPAINLLLPQQGHQLGLRPEHIRSVNTGGLEAKLTGREWLGNQQLLNLETKRGQLKMLTSADWTPPTELRVSWDQGRELWFEEQSGERLK